MKSSKQKLDEALEALRYQVQAIVREEQLRDQLTGLANGQALSELLRDAIENGDNYWLAFVEVDYFKRINDKFTYELADGLLQRIGRHLEDFSEGVSDVLPIRAHGDEFYLLGRWDTSDPGLASHIAHSLDQLRAQIAAISLQTDKGNMSCTVSVGWMTTGDGGDQALTERATMRMVEAAVGAAKIQGRNRVVRYSRDVEKLERRSLRDDCKACSASFTVEIPVNTPHAGPLLCPNCGAPHPRPAHPQSRVLD